MLGWYDYWVHVYHVSPKIRSGLILIFAPKDMVGLILGGCYIFMCNNITAHLFMYSTIIIMLKEARCMALMLPGHWFTIYTI